MQTIQIEAEERVEDEKEAEKKMEVELEEQAKRNKATKDTENDMKLAKEEGLRKQLLDYIINDPKVPRSVINYMKEQSCKNIILIF